MRKKTLFVFLLILISCSPFTVMFSGSLNKVYAAPPDTPRPVIYEPATVKPEQIIRVMLHNPTAIEFQSRIVVRDVRTGNQVSEVIVSLPPGQGDIAYIPNDTVDNMYVFVSITNIAAGKLPQGSYDIVMSVEVGICDDMPSGLYEHLSPVFTSGN